MSVHTSHRHVAPEDAAVALGFPVPLPLPLLLAAAAGLWCR